MAEERSAMLCCDICGKAFHCRLSRAQHKRVHSQFRPYACSFKACTKAFSTISEFQLHQRCHHNHRPHHCTKCGRQFIYRKHLILHRCSSKRSQLHCHWCDASFTHVNALSKHVRQDHNRMQNVLRTQGQGTKTKFKCVESEGKLKIMNIEAGRNKTNLNSDSDKDDSKILLKITAGKSTTIISPGKSSHSEPKKHFKKSKKKRKRPKEGRKNGIILSIKNGSVKLPETKTSFPKSGPAQIKESCKTSGEPFKQWNNLKLKIRTYPELTVTAKEKKTVNDTDIVTASSQTEKVDEGPTDSLLDMKHDNVEDSDIGTCPSENTDSKVRNGIVIHKDKSGKLLAEQLHKAKVKKRDNVFESFKNIGVWTVLPSPRTDSPSDVLKLKLSPQKPLRVDPAVCLQMDKSSPNYFDANLKAKTDQSGDDSDVFGTSPITDKEDGGMHNVNDSGIEVLSSSSCNRSNGNSVRSVILDENSPTYFITDDSPLSLDSPVMEPLNKVEHMICHKCGGKIMETNNNTRSPGKCNCVFASTHSPFPVLASPTKSAIIPVINGETGGSSEESLQLDLSKRPCSVVGEKCDQIETVNRNKDVENIPFGMKKDKDVEDFEFDTDHFSHSKFQSCKTSVSPSKEANMEETVNLQDQDGKPKDKDLQTSVVKSSNVKPIIIIDDESDEQLHSGKTSAEKCKLSGTESEKQISGTKRPLFRVKKGCISSTLSSNTSDAESSRSKESVHFHSNGEMTQCGAAMAVTEQTDSSFRSTVKCKGIDDAGDRIEALNTNESNGESSRDLHEKKSINDSQDHKKLEADVDTCSTNDVGTGETKDIIKKKPLFRRHTISGENKDVDSNKVSKPCLKRKAVSMSQNAESFSSDSSKVDADTKSNVCDIDKSVVERMEDLSQFGNNGDSQLNEKYKDAKICKLSSEKLSVCDSLNQKTWPVSSDEKDFQGDAPKSNNVQDGKESANSSIKHMSVNLLLDDDNDDSLQQLQDIEEVVKPQKSKPVSGASDLGLFQQQFLSFLSCSSPPANDQDSSKTATGSNFEANCKVGPKANENKNKEDDISQNNIINESKKTDSMSWLKIFSIGGANDNGDKKKDKQSKDDTEFTDDLAEIHEKMDISDDDDSNSLDVDDVFESKHLSFLEPKESLSITNIKKSGVHDVKSESKPQIRRPQTAKRSKVPCKVSSRRFSKGRYRPRNDSDSDDSSYVGSCDHLTDNSESDPDFNPFPDSDDDFVAAPVKRRQSIERRSKRCTINYESMLDDGDSKDICDGASDHAEAHSSRSRRVKQIRKSMCPCCLGSPEKKSQDHHINERDMYKLPKGYKQFIRSTVNLLELQEKIMQLFLSLFPECSDSISQCRVGTEDFDSLMDTVLSDLEKKDIPFEQEMCISSNSGCSAAIIPLNSQLAVFPAAVVTSSDPKLIPSQDMELHLASSEMLAGSGTFSSSSQPMAAVGSPSFDIQLQTCETKLDAAAMSSEKVETVNHVPPEAPADSVVHDVVKNICQEQAANGDVALPIAQNISFISGNNNVLAINADPALSVSTSQVHASSAYCLSHCLDESTSLTNCAADVALLDTAIGSDDSQSCEEALESGHSIDPCESVQSELIITIDWNAARVPVCRDPKACLRRLQKKIGKLVQYLLPEVELKDYYYRTPNNLEFLLDMMIKANKAGAQPLQDDTSQVDCNILLGECNINADCGLQFEPVGNESSVLNTIAHRKEVVIPVFSVCPELFKQEIKSHRESLNKHIFGKEEEPEEVFQSTDVISCIESLSKIARKKPVRSRRRSDAERRTLFVQEKLQNSHNSTIVCHTNTRSLFSDLEVRSTQKSNLPENSKEKFLSDLNLGGNQDTSREVIASSIDEEQEPANEKPENNEEVEHTDSDDSSNEAKRKSGDKNIFELMQPQQETPTV